MIKFSATLLATLIAASVNAATAICVSWKPLDLIAT